MGKTFLVLGLLAISAGSAVAKPPLSEIRQIDDAVFDVAVADKIRRECPSLAPRLVRAYALYREARRVALGLGYTEAEIEAYADSDVEKARLRAKGEAYLRTRGVVASDPQSYCAAGRKEIEKSSRIGSLLREK